VIKILGVNRFPARVFWSCIALAAAASIVPHWLVPPIVAGGALWIASFAVRSEVSLIKLEMWERQRSARDVIPSPTTLEGARNQDHIETLKDHWCALVGFGSESVPVAITADRRLITGSCV
jgi:hypothetical protein